MKEVLAWIPYAIASLLLAVLANALIRGGM